MAFEIFGFIVKTEIDIGDVAAIAALVSSALIFYFGYSRTRKSEQIKIAREIYDKIYPTALKLAELWTQKGTNDEDRTKHLDKGLEVLAYLLQQITYFTYLIEIKDIRDKHVLKIYLDSIPAILHTMDGFCRFSIMHNQNKDLLEIRRQKIENLRQTWDKMGKGACESDRLDRKMFGFPQR